MNNSFIAGKPVTGKNLIGREKVLSDAEKLLLSGESIVLIAPRRMGKTSVILELINRIKEKNFYTIYIDIFSTPTKNILAEEITKALLSNKKSDLVFYKIKDKLHDLLKSIEFKQTIEDFEFILDFAAPDSKNEFYLLKNSIEFIDAFSKKNKTNCIAAFDEFADISKLDGVEIIKLFRSVLQRQSNANYIFSGSYESMMKDIFITKSSPFYRFARIIELEEIAKEDFFLALTEKFNLMKIKISENAIKEILGFTGGHPYYTQLLAQIISLGSGKKVDLMNIPEIIEQGIIMESNYIETVWVELSKSRELIQVLIAFAGDISPYSTINNKKINIPRAVRKLKNQGYIKKKEGKWNIIDPFLRYWIRTRVLKLYKTNIV
jgi:uncharacterized protein